MKQQNRLFFLLSLLLWVYLWLRAIYIPLAHDEVATFFYYVHTGKFLPFLSHWDANNHFLNSALTFCSYRLFGSSPLVLRLPNLLFAPLFFYYCYRLAMELSHSTLSWIFFLTFALSHSFLEFFALSRGYGMSMALLFAAIFYLVMAWRKDKLRDIFLSLLFMMGATFGNLGLINTYLLLIVAILLKFVISPPIDVRKRWLILLMVFFEGLVPLAFFAKILLYMQKIGNLYTGSNVGFWTVTVKTLTKMLSYGHSAIFNYFVIFFFILTCILFIRPMYRKGWLKTIETPEILFFLLIGNILASLTLGILFRVHYPEDRIALYFVLFQVGSLLFLLDRFLPPGEFQPTILFALPFLFFPVQFLHRLNISYLSYYSGDNIPPRFYDKVYATLVPGNFPPTVGGDRGRHFCWSYLNYRKGGKLSELFYNDYPGFIADFQIVKSSACPRWMNYYNSIDFDKYSGRELLQRKQSVEKVLAINYTNISTHGDCSYEFYNLFEQSAKPLVGNALCITLDLSIKSNAKPFITWIVTSVCDSANNLLIYERVPLEWMKDQWIEPGNNLKEIMLIPEIPSKAKTIVTYIWNMDKVPFSVNNGTVIVYKINP
jgi:hypothetical protein